jgi:transcriptional regulator of arginine metabolism
MILEIIENETIETQEDLAKALQARKHQRLPRQPSPGTSRSCALSKPCLQRACTNTRTVDKAETSIADRFSRIFSESALSIDSAGNLLVIKTISGRGKRSLRSA